MDETITQEQIENIEKILTIPIKTDEDYLILAELTDDEE